MRIFLTVGMGMPVRTQRNTMRVPAKRGSAPRTRIATSAINRERVFISWTPMDVWSDGSRSSFKFTVVSFQVRQEQNVGLSTIYTSNLT